MKLLERRGGGGVRDEGHIVLTVEVSEVDAQIRMGASAFRFKSNLTSYSHISWKKFALISPRLMQSRHKCVYVRERVREREKVI